MKNYDIVVKMIEEMYAKQIARGNANGENK